jgi:hypothetical protein
MNSFVFTDLVCLLDDDDDDIRGLFISSRSAL